MRNRQALKGQLTNATGSMEHLRTKFKLKYFRGAENEIVSRLVWCTYCSP